MSDALVPVARISVKTEIDRCARYLQDLFGDRSITSERFDETLASKQLLFAGYPQVGSAGLLVERSTGKIAPLLAAPLALHLSWGALWMLPRGLEAVDRADGPLGFVVNPTTLPPAYWPDEGAP